MGLGRRATRDPALALGVVGLAALVAAACAHAHHPDVDRGSGVLLVPASETPYSPCTASYAAATRLDPENPVHVRYLSGVKTEIQAHWIQPFSVKQSAETVEAAAAFAIHADRSIRGIKVVRSAGAANLDRYAVNAIRLAAAFLPALPEPAMGCIELTARFVYWSADVASPPMPAFPGRILDLREPALPSPARCADVTSPSRDPFFGGVPPPAEFPYPGYLRLVRAQILERWGPPARTAGRLRAVVLFELGRDGRVRGEPQVEVSSGHAAFDTAAIDAVRAAGPFCRFPSEARPELLRVHFGFESD